MRGSIPQLPKIVSLYEEEIDLGISFDQAAERFADDQGSVLLLSGLETDSSRYSILGVYPWLELKGWQDRLCLKVRKNEYTLVYDPFDLVHLLLEQLESPPSNLPVAAGLLGYFAYDLKDRIEDLPRTCIDTHLPDICLYSPGLILIQDRVLDKTILSVPIPHDVEEKSHVREMRSRFFSQLDRPMDPQGFFVDNRGFTSSYTKEEYIRAVEKIISYLKAGDIYQANLSQRFETGFSGSAYALFLELFRRNPASFFSFINAGDHRIVSTSPERFIKLEGRDVETRPIKGTLVRGRCAATDLENGERLMASPKDDAELTMIVDLMRNDLSRVTEQGSVVVSDHKRLETYENVFHLVSIVKGTLLSDRTPVDLLRATFPGGSITGCPKIRSMEIIDELETVKRHVYTGSIGYISFHGTMDLSIAIRTAIVFGSRLSFSVGGGIVYDSEPEKEYQETLDKGKTLMETLSKGSSFNPERPLLAWVDGRLIDQDRAMVSAGSAGFQYGAGLFETIRVEKGRVCCLNEHLYRMEQAWTRLFNSSPPDISWARVIDLVIKENRLEGKVCAVKLMVARDEQANGKQVFLAVFARPYVHRLEVLGKPGLDLVSFPQPRTSFLADHKTMNYLYYNRAGAYARRNNGDEALVLNPDLSVSETNTGNIMVLVPGDENNGYKAEVVLPASSHVLPGVAQDEAVQGLMRHGYTVRREKMTPKVLSAYPNVLVTNSLMGAVKVLTIDGRKISHKEGVCDMVNSVLSRN